MDASGKELPEERKKESMEKQDQERTMDPSANELLEEQSVWRNILIRTALAAGLRRHNRKNGWRS